MLEIRVASTKDAKELLEIYTPYVENTAITFEYEVPSLEEFQGRIEHTLKKFPYLVALIDGKIAGYAYVSPFKERAAYDWAVETSIYVKMEERGNGVGKQLYLKLEEILSKMGILNMNACIAYTDHEDEHLTNKSIFFHEALGYKMVGQFHDCGYKFDTWYHMVWMEKMIGEHKVPQERVTWFPEL